MKQADKKLLAQWLDERDQIWRRYLEPLDAVEEFYCPTCEREVLVHTPEGKLYPLRDNPELRDSNAGRSLIANRAYYFGAVDALRSIGLNVNVCEGRHYVDGQKAR